MASKNKKVRATSYKNPDGWGDSVSVSRKANEELAENQKEELVSAEDYTKKKTSQLTKYSTYTPETTKTKSKVITRTSAAKAKKEENKKPQKEDNIKSEVNNQVEQLNKEFNNAVTEIENILERFLTQLWSAGTNFVLALYNLILKLVFYLVVEPLKNAGKISTMILNSINDRLNDLNEWLTVSPGKSVTQVKQQTPKKAEYVAPKDSYVSPQTVNKEPPIESIPDLSIENEYPDVFYGINFGGLAKKGIIFLNIKNVPMISEGKKEFSVEEEQEYLNKSLMELKNCSKLAKNLPSPTNGRYSNRTMMEILENAGMADLKDFLKYVDTHPGPFIDKRFRLSEAFATWAHKGAPI